LSRTKRVCIIGAGIAGLAAAAALSARGLNVTVFERASGPGGKMRSVEVAGRRIDAGPTVFTMRWAFDDLFAESGGSFSQAVSLRPAETIARHAWDGDQRLDLFPDIERSADAIGALCGPVEARGYRTFCARARDIYETLDHSFIRAGRPSPLSLFLRVGPHRLASLLRISPFATLWSALGEHFQDPRLRQLFGRYATYCGSSPFRAPATLMLVAHVEREGVWLVEGGMHRIAKALAALARARGATIRYDCHVNGIVAEHGRAGGVALRGGEIVAADAVIANTDVNALASGLLGATAAGAVDPVPSVERSLSAITWAIVAETEGFPLLYHNVFFSRDYAAEFDSIFDRGRVPEEPTVYVCAQDRGNRDGPRAIGPERLLCLINAPPTGDAHAFEPAEIAACEQRTFRQLARCGLRIREASAQAIATSPAQFHRLFPGTGGALYGPASHGWAASFRREGARSRLPGLYLAGGSVHPGPGVPIAAISGRLAASAVLADLASNARFQQVAMPGGMSMR
jgi:1-hydroxycarotenoid 3,4-desaturase